MILFEFGGLLFGLRLGLEQGKTRKALRGIVYKWEGGCMRGILRGRIAGLEVLASSFK